MKHKTFIPSHRFIHRIWLGFFGIWILLLSGVFESGVQTPGLRQWFGVHSALKERRQEIAVVEAESASLKETEQQLEGNSVAQEREIRKVLGFVDQNEIVFEFEK